MLVTLFDQADQQDARAQVVQRFAEARPGDAQHVLRDVDFRRGRSGEGRIVVDLSDNATGIDIQQQGRQLIVDFIKTSLPRNLERRLDVQDFGTPVRDRRHVRAGPEHAHGDRAARACGSTRPIRSDNRFIVEVKPILEDPNKLTQGTRQGYKGEKLSLNFQNVEVRVGAAGDRRLHRAQHHHQRHRAGQPDAAAQGHSRGTRRSTSSCRPRASTCARTAMSCSSRRARSWRSRRSSSSNRRRRSATSSRCRPRASSSTTRRRRTCSG